MKKFRLSMSRKRMITGILFILPWLVGFLYFYVRTLFMTGEFSLSEIEIASGGGYNLLYVGLENFRYAFRAHASFKQVLATSMLDMVIDVPLIIFFSLFVAMLLNRKFKGRAVVRAIFFLPIILNADAVSEALAMQLQMMTGGISTVSSEIAASASSSVNISYYISLFENLAMPRVVLEYIVSAVSRISDIITASGVQIIIFIAALQSIPPALYEVSRIEGATGYETFWKITFPMVMPHIITNVVYTVIDAFAKSDVVDLAYETAFTDYNYGLSSVFSLVSTVLVSLLLVLVVRAIQKHTFYYN
ncbi:MAG TPA: sugar ABC transporter permease [Candidatus Limiplasma sp.]|nr:sugar ABC transporter permease [Candidatus Limiplasma sp.]